MKDAAFLVAALRDSVDAFEADWRRRFLPPPTRDRPRPDPAALDGARRLEAAGRELDALAAQLRARPAATAREAEADAALREHAAFLLDLLGGAADARPLSPDQLSREIDTLREVAQRRAATAGAASVPLSGSRSG